jgi:hypothetical protein
LSHVNLENVKLVRLAVHFILCFIGLFLVSAGIRFLAIRLEWTRLLTLQPEALQNELVAAFQWALSFSLYFSIILGLCFINRDRIFALPAIVCIIVLAVGLTYSVSLGLGSMGGMIIEKIPGKPIGGPGLILSNPTRPNGTAIVLLEGPSAPGGGRVVAIPDRPMVFQENFPGKDIPVSILSMTPFGEESPWVFRSLAIDLKISADNLKQHYNEGLIPFLIYTGALAVLLSSFLFIMNFSAWPLANFFLCCLAFRGVLYMENLLNSPDMQIFFDSLLKNFLPISAVIPMLFCVVGLLAYLYTFLIYLAKRKSVNEI